MNSHANGPTEEVPGVSGATVRLRNNMWELFMGTSFARAWRRGPPSRREIIMAVEIYEATPADPDAPDTLGWREWRMRPDGTLMSPVMGNPWLASSLSAATWDDSAAVEGRAGIHAYRCPRDWRLASMYRDDTLTMGDVITGLVERHGRYVLGTRGWRAERVRILGLVAPDVVTAALLALRYPDVDEIVVRTIDI